MFRHQTPPKTLLFATTNRGKLREAMRLLAELPVTLKCLDDFSPIPAPPETEESFEGNAKLKALYYAKHCDCWTVADDSGLEVDALGGAPGVHSAYFAGFPGNDDANNAKLIRELAAIPAEKRTARFRCALVLAAPGRVLATTSGTMEGTIVDAVRGANGFGYDPHFFIPELGCTAAELPPDRKNQVSHRGQALAALKSTLIQLIDGPATR